MSDHLAHLTSLLEMVHPWLWRCTHSRLILILFWQRGNRFQIKGHKFSSSTRCSPTQYILPFFPHCGYIYEVITHNVISSIVEPLATDTNAGSFEETIAENSAKSTGFMGIFKNKKDCNKDATPLLTHRRYVYLALTHRYEHSWRFHVLCCYLLTSFRVYSDDLPIGSESTLNDIAI